MPNTRTLQVSFNGGELAPNMYGRLDDQRYQFGVSTMRNFIATPQGQAITRPGSQFVCETGNMAEKCRVIAINSNPSTVLILGTNYARFARDGQPLTLQAQALDYQLPQTFTINSQGVMTFASDPSLTTGDQIGFTNAGGYLPVYTSYSLIVYTLASGRYSNGGAFHQFRINDPFSISGTGPTGPNPLYYARRFGNWNATYTFTAHTSAGNQVGPNTGGPAVPGPYYHYFASISQPAAVTPEPYSVVRQSSTQFQIRLTPSAPVITGVTSSGTGTHTCHKYYTVGTLVYWANPGNVGQAAGYYRCTTATYATSTGPEVGKWALESSAQVQIALPVTYTQSDLFEVTYSQSGNSVTLCHRNYPTVLISRQLSGLTYNWVASLASLNATLEAPTNIQITAVPGPQIKFLSFANTGAKLKIVCEGTHNLVKGDYIYFSGTGISQLDQKIYAVEDPTLASYTEFTFRACALTSVSGITNGQSITTAIFLGWVGGTLPQNASSTARIENWPDGSENINRYKVTALTADGLETQPSSAVSENVNNLYARGASNRITWDAVAGAQRYRVYREISGLYGLVGETDATLGQAFVDENVTPDFAQTPPIEDSSLKQTFNYPQAVAYFEQRKCFAGTNTTPAKVWLTRPFTEADLTFSIPLKDTDRVAFGIASKDNQSIRHLAPLQDLLVLTDRSEFRVTSINTDVITPTSISVRPQSFVGANFVTPVIVNNSLLYCSARGGHLREAGFDSRSNGYVTGDISIRAAHLFDEYDILDLAYSRSPYPIVWAVSSSGKLLGLSYVPEERVGGWHQHTTDGVFESVCSVQEGAYDSVYAVVRRTKYVAGVATTVRYVERFVLNRQYNNDLSVFLDSCLFGNGTNTGLTTMTISQYGGGTFEVGQLVLVTSSTAAFVASDLDDKLVITAADGSTCTLAAKQYLSTTQIVCTVETAISSGLYNTATTSWAWARNSWSGLSHLEGKSVSVIADGSYVGEYVVSNGTIQTTANAVRVTVGLKYDSLLSTLPVISQAEAMLQGRTKNVSRVWLRVEGDAAFKVGPSAGDLVPAMLEPTQNAKYTQTLVAQQWDNDGSIDVYKDTPGDLRIINLVMEVGVGG
jgi:hypothetical protein